MRIGIAGLGRMGAAMAARLIEVGHEVTVWNRSADKAKPVVDAGGGKYTAQEPRGARERSRDRRHLPDRRGRDRQGFWRPLRPAGRRSQRQACHRDEHGAAGRADRARRKGARQGRRLCRMPGRRLDRPGAPGQADRPDGRRAGRCGACKAAARSALPAARARRPGGRRRGDEVHHQHAADDLLAGARRGAGAVQPARPRSRSASWSLSVRHVGQAPTC